MRKMQAPRRRRLLSISLSRVKCYVNQNTTSTGTGTAHRVNCFLRVFTSERYSSKCLGSSRDSKHQAGFVPGTCTLVRTKCARPLIGVSNISPSEQYFVQVLAMYCWITQWITFVWSLCVVIRYGVFLDRDMWWCQDASMMTPKFLYNPPQ